MKDIQKANRDENLSKIELKQYRKMTFKVNWLAQSTRPDLCYMGLDMAKKINSSTISDLKRVNVVLNKVREQGSKVRFCKIGEKEDLELIGIGDALYKSDEKSVGGVLLFLTNRKMSLACPLY